MDYGIVTRVKPVRRRLNGTDVNICGKFVVQFAPQRLGSQRCVQLEVRNLRERVDAGVGAARTI